MDDRAERILTAIGGADNVVDIEPCIIRLRCRLDDPTLVDETALRALGVIEITVTGDNDTVQLVVGPAADAIAGDIEDLL